MATSLPAISALISQNKAVDESANKLIRFVAQRALPNMAVTTANQTVPDDTLTAATELQLTKGVGFNGDLPVIGGRKYLVEAYLPCTASGTAAGFAVTMAAGSCTATDVQLSYQHFTASAVATTNTTALATSAGAATTGVILVKVVGTFKATGSGTFGPQFAEAASVGDAVLLKGAWLSLTEIAS
jgi:hypothetical protein